MSRVIVNVRPDACTSPAHRPVSCSRRDDRGTGGAGDGAEVPGERTGLDATGGAGPSLAGIPTTGRPAGR
ncbi:MAG: hypothetical protein IPL43_06470 [Micropruina sp.]|nr:hypothetical protein [Micropruina sp.]